MEKQSLRYALAHSTYITAAWNWILETLGRAAEAILVVSVLYASVKLLPVVHMPNALDVIVFIAQFVALDVGGLSLSKLAKQAGEEGNEQGAQQAARMSKALIVVMIAGVIVVALEQLFPIPAGWKLAIDTILLIARSILAVLYGHIIHSLRPDEMFATSKPNKAMAEMQASLEQQLAQVSHEQKQMLQAVKHLQNDLQNADIQNCKVQICNLQNDMQKRLQVADEQPAKTQSMQSPKPASQTVKITPINQARAKHETAEAATSQGKAKLSHAEVTAFMEAHPAMKRADVATQLGISERKVYDAIAWQKEQFADGFADLHIAENAVQ